MANKMDKSSLAAQIREMAMNAKNNPRGNKMARPKPGTAPSPTGKNMPPARPGVKPAPAGSVKRGKRRPKKRMY